MQLQTLNAMLIHFAEILDQFEKPYPHKSRLSESEKRYHLGNELYKSDKCTLKKTNSIGEYIEKSIWLTIKPRNRIAFVRSISIVSFRLLFGGFRRRRTGVHLRRRLFPSRLTPWLGGSRQTTASTSTSGSAQKEQPHDQH